MATAIIQLLTVALQLWDDKEKHKYIDRQLAIEKDYYEELKKPDSERSDARLDEFEFELRQLARDVASAIGAKNAPAK